MTLPYSLCYGPWESLLEKILWKFYTHSTDVSKMFYLCLFSLLDYSLISFFPLCGNVKSVFDGLYIPVLHTTHMYFPTCLFIRWDELYFECGENKQKRMRKAYNNNESRYFLPAAAFDLFQNNLVRWVITDPLFRMRFQVSTWATNASI